MKTPVLFLLFNRPEQTFRVFEEIRKANPEKLFIAADGPRSDKEGEAEKCTEVRKVAELVDWECEVQTLFREKNLGCKIAVSEGITWFFNNVEEGIILEDDCLPDPSFFTFCETLLEKYRNNEKIVCISGTNFQFGIKRGDASYYFSIYPNIWGWASWSRAWKKYDVNLDELDSFKTSGKIRKSVAEPKEQEYWMKRFEGVKKGEFNTWDYQWVFACWNNEGISISPNYNLVTNIGFGGEATHTHSEIPTANMPLEKPEKIIHPGKIKINREADNFIFEHIYGSPFQNWNDKIRAYVGSIIPGKLKEKIKQLKG